MALVTLRNRRVEFVPGAVASGTTIDLPAGYQAAAYSHAEIHRYDHSHVAFTVTTTAGSVTAPAEIIPGSGTQLGTIASVGTAALPAANENASTSSATDIPAVVAATPTYVSATSLSLSVATEANDVLVVDLVLAGDEPVWQ